MEMHVDFDDSDQSSPGSSPVEEPIKVYSDEPSLSTVRWEDIFEDIGDISEQWKNGYETELVPTYGDIDDACITFGDKIDMVTPSSTGFTLSSDYRASPLSSVGDYDPYMSEPVYGPILSLADQKDVMRPVRVTRTGRKRRMPLPRVQQGLAEKVSHYDSTDPSMKNAIQAKLNRERKKMQLQQLDDKVSLLESKNKMLLDDQAVMAKEKLSLEAEIRYLRNVIANQSLIANVIKNLPQCGNVNLQAAIVHDHDYNVATEASGGVCLHVDKNNVFIEFCAECAARADQAFS